MRSLLAGIIGVAVISLPGDGTAQEAAEPTPYWYVTHYKIPFAKVDSLVGLEQT